MTFYELDVRDLVTNSLQQTALRVEAPELREAAALGGLEYVRKHFTVLDHERPNKLGGARTHFYAQAAESARWLTEGQDVVFDVPEPVGLGFAIHGGTVEAGKNPSCKTGQPTKYLTVPAKAEAYGHRACDFGDLIPMFRRRGGTVRAVALVKAEQQTVEVDAPRRKDGTTRRGRVTGFRKEVKVGGATYSFPDIFFWLVESITREGDPRVAPDPAKVAAGAREAVASYLGSLQGEVRL